MSVAVTMNIELLMNNETRS